MSDYRTRDCGCTAPQVLGGKRPEKCDHGNWFQTDAELEPPKRKPMRKEGQGLAAAPAQQKKVRHRPCVSCGRDGTETKIEAAHVCARRLAPHCDCPGGVVPLCSRCHSLYDDLSQPFDLLPSLVEHGYLEETVHGFVHHGVGLVELLNHITGAYYAPAADYERQLEVARGRIAELEAAIHV